MLSLLEVDTPGQTMIGAIKPESQTHQPDAAGTNARSSEYRVPLPVFKSLQAAGRSMGQFARDLPVFLG
jgi:hypothetical protein